MTFFYKNSISKTKVINYCKIYTENTRNYPRGLPSGHARNILNKLQKPVNSLAETCNNRPAKSGVQHLGSLTNKQTPEMSTKVSPALCEQYTPIFQEKNHFDSLKSRVTKQPLEDCLNALQENFNKAPLKTDIANQLKGITVVKESNVNSTSEPAGDVGGSFEGILSIIMPSSVVDTLDKPRQMPLSIIIKDQITPSLLQQKKEELNPIMGNELKVNSYTFLETQQK
jgi:hypothetical protein